VIEGFVREFTNEKIPDVVKIGRGYYQADPSLIGLMEDVDKSLNRQAYSAGLFLGEEKSKKFKPSIALLDFVGKSTDKWLVVDDKAEWPFLCGRDVFAKSVIESNVSRGLVIVLNKKKEVLGYGKITGDIADKEKVYVKNILDRGDFLRREMRKKSK
jgi:ribosome biogenesis protein Nip4